ncbi:MAG: hypothetical protein P4M15_01060, partial [Alphaproteobacteria bacterium]|nr:hypothetical protein [Alphaproteobacteria bacterium]
MSQQVSALSVQASPRRPGGVPAPALHSLPLSSPLPARGLVPTVFHEPWWLTVASQGRYREVEVQSGGGVVGRLPYLATKRFGMTHIAMPMLTHFLGPAIQESTGGETARCLHRLSVTKDLIGQLPRASHVYIKHHCATSDTLAFQALGFHTDVQFTWEIAPDAPDVLWRRMRDKTRNVIRRAEEKLQVMEVTDAEKFMSFYEENLRHRHAS